MPVFTLGQATITRVEETNVPSYKLRDVFTEMTDAQFSEHKHWLAPHHYEAESGRIRLSVHSWLLQIGGKKILIDSCCGNNKVKPGRPFWHMLNVPFLERLAAAGARPEEIDLVMCTHLHHDHVGWNTQLRDGRWVPTFSNARYIFGRQEWESLGALHREIPQPHLVDSVLPVIEAHQAQVVVTGGPAHQELAESLRKAARHPVVVLAGQTTLRQLGACLEQSRLVVSNDTGVLHIAAALRRPVVALYGPTSPALTGPLGDPQRTVVLHHPDCCPRIPCLSPDRPVHLGMNAITVDEAYEAARRLLEQGT